LQVLKSWATPANVPALIELLHDRSRIDKAAIAAALAATRSERAAEAVAKQLPLQPGVSDALMDMGPVAERFVLPFLKDRNNGTRREACRVLGAIGTQKSTEALRELARGGDMTEAHDAERALRLIESRSSEIEP
jgi:HEAT repeat protein